MLSSYFLLLCNLIEVWGIDGQKGGYRDLVCAEDRTVILEVQAGLRLHYVGLNCSLGLRERAGEGIFNEEKAPGGNLL